ncbi:hypothetical protein WJX81_004743 [Elliptochloris bilobata]|uniref:Uncharacterized protein n=1 Tax=Elliptochloris bilobata TaxID=381761 RepID=A0AAW1SFW0_9CHLO
MANEIHSDSEEGGLATCNGSQQARTACVTQQVKQMMRLVAEKATPYMGEPLRPLRAEVGNQAAVLGFVGAPLTLHAASRAACAARKLADNITDFVRFQADAGTQAGVDVISVDHRGDLRNALYRIGPDIAVQARATMRCWRWRSLM